MKTFARLKLVCKFCITYPMRGQALFNDLFTNNLVAIQEEPQVKGRCKVLNEKRDDLLLHRYFFYGKTSNIRYEIIIATLATEFFLTERRVQDIITGNSDRLKSLRSEPPTVLELRKRWPHLNWN